MSSINILDQQTANLIAAGEVVDRPAAVAKELLENAIDAGATKITVEIKNGGSSLIRVTDNGKGMDPEDVRNCVLRHATSKIKSPEDLEGISTLGFRGEALAAISSVSRFQVISKEPSNDFGICMSMEGEVTTAFEEVGCPDGTTVTVRDIFFNVPARRKFLKKDATETAYISQYVERIALSHPEISFRFIADSKTKFLTPGNGMLKDTVYAVFGREFSESMMPIEREGDKVKISGFVSIPDMSRINRNHQIIFVNNRLVRSRIISYAVEDAYKSYIMTEKFPAFVLFIDINPYMVDINVHPTKLEVRFTDDTAIREAVYFAVKNELEKHLNPIKQDYFDTINKNIENQNVKNAFVPIDRTPISHQQEIHVDKTPINAPKTSYTSTPISTPKVVEDLFKFLEATPTNEETGTVVFKDSGTAESVREQSSSYYGTINSSKEDSANTVHTDEEKEKFDNDINTTPASKYAKYCGIVFNAYIIAEFDDNMYLVDKHAAHERIIYEKLKRTGADSLIQTVIDTRTINLSAVQFQCAMDNINEIISCGFDIEQIGETSIALRGIPTEFSNLDLYECENILIGMIDDILEGKSARLTKSEIFDRSLYTAACKAATKAGWADEPASYEWLLNKLFELDNIFCCPHGRPIIVKYTKYQIEKMFNRT